MNDKQKFAVRKEMSIMKKNMRRRAMAWFMVAIMVAAMIVPLILNLLR